MMNKNESELKKSWREYHLAVAEMGPDHPETIKKWDKVRATPVVLVLFVR